MAFAGIDAFQMGYCMLSGEQCGIRNLCRYFFYSSHRVVLTFHASFNILGSKHILTHFVGSVTSPLIMCWTV